MKLARVTPNMVLDIEQIFIAHISEDNRHLIVIDRNGNRWVIKIESKTPDEVLKKIMQEQPGK